MGQSNRNGQCKIKDSVQLNRSGKLDGTDELQKLKCQFDDQEMDLELQYDAMKDALGDLEESRNRYATLYDFAPIGYMTFDDKGCIQEINLLGAALLGMERNQLIGVPMSTFIDKNSYKDFFEHLRLCKDTRERVLTELRLSIKNTPQIHIKLVSIPLLKNGIYEQLYITAIIDITKLKNAEVALVRLNAELENRVIERTRELQTINEVLKKAYERKRQNDLLNDLIKTEGLPKQNSYEAALKLGLKLGEPLTCFLLVIEEWEDKSEEFWQQHFRERQLLYDGIIDSMEEETDWFAWESPDGIGIIHFGVVSDRALQEYQIEMAEHLRDRTASNAPGLTMTIGVAEIASAVVDLSVHYRQSKQAVTMGRTVWPGKQIYHYLDMGIFQILPHVENKKMVASYIERTLGALQRYEQKKKTDFLLTLEVILESDNLKEAAGKLSLHQKTLEFRKKRIEQILGRTLDHFETRVSLYMALKLMKITDGNYCDILGRETYISKDDK